MNPLNFGGATSFQRPENPIDLREDGYVRPRPAIEYDAIPLDHLRYFRYTHARYLLVTTELVTFLKGIIGTQSALEIGAGAGDLGHALGIKMVDNYCQELPEVREYYKALGQPPVAYGRDVQKRTANSAVKKWRPDVVIGAWVTHWVDPNLPLPPGGGNIYGIKEDEILKDCKWYVMIGSEAVHNHKPLMKLPHETIDAHFVRSRSERDDNKIWIWKGEK
jgi:hypothetical protein